MLAVTPGVVWEQGGERRGERSCLRGRPGPWGSPSRAGGRIRALLEATSSFVPVKVSVGLCQEGWEVGPAVQGAVSGPASSPLPELERGRAPFSPLVLLVLVLPMGGVDPVPAGRVEPSSSGGAAFSSAVASFLRADLRLGQELEEQPVALVVFPRSWLLQGVRRASLAPSAQRTEERDGTRVGEKLSLLKIRCHPPSSRRQTTHLQGSVCPVTLTRKGGATRDSAASGRRAVDGACRPRPPFPGDTWAGLGSPDRPEPPSAGPPEGGAL